MKKTFTILLLLVCLKGFSQEKYSISGSIAGEAEGNNVYLFLNDYKEDIPVDTTVIKGGKFRFDGRVDMPAYYRIAIDRTPESEESSHKYWTSSYFYLENSPISYEAHIDSLTTYYYQANKKPAIIKGSKTQDEYEAFRNSLQDKRKQLSDLHTEYMEKYHLPSIDGVYNTEEGIRISKAIIPVEKEIHDKHIEYIRQHPQSVVAYDLARLNFLNMFVEITVEEIDELIALVEKGWEGTTRYTEFVEMAEKAKKTALYSSYQDFELLTPEGNQVKLSSLVPQGQYCMLEFWASWCGPCRGEIPHLAKINEKYKDSGFKIISISIDENESRWKKAMEEEKMVWTQLNEPNGFDGEIAKAYNILGIPFAILLDPDGRIVDFNMRGAKLDAALLDIYKF